LSSDNLTIPKISANGSQSAILQALRDHGPISRSGLASLTGMTLQAVSRTVGPMLKDDLLVELPQADTRGQRRKRGLGLNRDIGCAMAISYGPNAVEGVIMDTGYNVLQRDSQQIALQKIDKEEKLLAIFAFTAGFFSHIPTGLRCLALGVVDPGVVDAAAGLALSCSIMDHWADVPVVQRFQDEFHLPVLLTCDNQACIRAVDRLELKGRIRNLIYVEYNEGISCCLKLGGHYIRGGRSLAGEFGHIPATELPVPCQCGAVGCLEALVAMPALAKQTADAITSGSNSVLSANIANLCGRDVLIAAANGDRLADRIVHEAYELLGRNIGGLINTLAPEMVLFENTISLAGESRVWALFETIRRNTLPSHEKYLKLQISTLTSHVAGIGGAAEVLDYCLG